MYDARISLDEQLDAFNTNVENNDNFAASVDQATFQPGYEAVLTSEQNADLAVALVTDLQNIAIELSKTTLSASDRANFNTLYEARQDELDALLNPPSADNLLTTNASLTIAINGVLNFETTAGVDFNGAGYPEFDPTLPAPDQATAGATATALAGYLEDIQNLNTALTQDRQQLQQIQDQFDPFSAVVAELQSLTNELDDIQESARTDFGQVDTGEGGAESLGLNLLAQNAADGKVQLVNGTVFVTEGIADFQGQVTAIIENANTTILSDRAAGNALLNNALFNLTDIQLQLNSDLRPQQQALYQFAATIAENTDDAPEPTSEFANPYAEATDFTLQFIQLYLALSDQNNQAQSQDPILQLLNAGSGGQDQGAAGIVNLLV